LARLTAQLAPLAYFFFVFFRDPVVSKLTIAMLVVSVVWIGLVIVFTYVVPMKRRIDLLTQLLEEEIKRPR
jgi:hypothetical protein